MIKKPSFSSSFVATIVIALSLLTIPTSALASLSDKQKQNRDYAIKSMARLDNALSASDTKTASLLLSLIKSDRPLVGSYFPSSTYRSYENAIKTVNSFSNNSSYPDLPSFEGIKIPSLQKLVLSVVISETEDSKKLRALRNFILLSILTDDQKDRFLRDLFVKSHNYTSALIHALKIKKQTESDMRERALIISRLEVIEKLFKQLIQ